MFLHNFESNLVILACTADDTEIYKNKIRESCLRAIENAEKLKQHLTGGGGDNAENTDE